MVKWIRTAFEKRPQWEKGAWLCQAWFEWNIMQDNGDLATYTVLLMDEGYDWRKKVDFKATQIRIEILVTKSEEALEEEWGSAMDEELEEKARQLGLLLFNHLCKPLISEKTRLNSTANPGKTTDSVFSSPLNDRSSSTILSVKV